MSCRHRVIVMSAIVISVLLIPDSHCELVCDSSAVAPFLSQAAFCWRSRGAELPDVSSTRLCCGIAGTHKWLKLIPEGWHTLLVYTLNKMVSLCGHAHTHAHLLKVKPNITQFFTGQVPFLLPKQQHQSTEGRKCCHQCMTNMYNSLFTKNSITINKQQIIQWQTSDFYAIAIK